MQLNFTQLVIAIMKKHNINSITIEYNGEGDSGCVEYPVLDYSKEIKDPEKYHKAVDDDLFKLIASFDEASIEESGIEDYVELVDGKYVLAIVKGNHNSIFEKLLYRFADDYLENHHGCWQDNEGSRGQFEWRLKDESCTLHRQVPVTEWEEFEEKI